MLSEFSVVNQVAEMENLEWKWPADQLFLVLKVGLSRSAAKCFVQLGSTLEWGAKITDNGGAANSSVIFFGTTVAIAWPLTWLCSWTIWRQLCSYSLSIFPNALLPGNTVSSLHASLQKSTSPAEITQGDFRVSHCNTGFTASVWTEHWAHKNSSWTFPWSMPWWERMTFQMPSDIKHEVTL